MSTTYTMGTHYAGAWIGYVVAFAFAVRKMPSARARVALIACGALCVLEFFVADPLHPGLNLRKTEARDVALDRFLQTLPPNAEVATQEEAYTHLALTDPNAKLLPETSNQSVNACFVLLDQDFPDSARLEEYWTAFMQLLDRGRYTLATHEDTSSYIVARTAAASRLYREGVASCGAVWGRPLFRIRRNKLLASSSLRHPCLRSSLRRPAPPHSNAHAFAMPPLA